MRRQGMLKHQRKRDMTWETPQYLFDRLNDEFKFELDVCANNDTAKCEYGFYSDNEDDHSK